MIGYYAHSHGNGHSNYANVMAEHHRDKCIIFTDSSFQFWDDAQKIILENEHLNGEEFDISVFKNPEYLHYAPVGLKKITRRNLLILKGFLKYNISLLIIDVSVEVAALARVSSIPYAYVKMMGNRNDKAHLDAYRGASFLLAYYPKSFESRQTPLWVINKTLYLGFISKSCDRSSKQSLNPDPNLVIVIQGAGGNAINDQFLHKLSIFFTNKKIVVIGDVSASQQFENICFKGYVNNLDDYIDRAYLIIAACGSNLTAEIINRNRTFLILAEDRPYDEQKQFAIALEENNIGILFDIDAIQKSIDKFFLLPEMLEDRFKPTSFDKFWNLLIKWNFNIEHIAFNILKQSLMIETTIPQHNL